MTHSPVLPTDELTAAVDDLRDPLVGFLQALVQTPSLPNHEHAVQSLVADRLRALGLTVTVVPTRFADLAEHPAFGDDGFSPDQRINVVGRWAGHGGSGGRGSLLLNGHVDVVSPGDKSLWTAPPWSGLIRDGRLYGRGSCDMKAGIATALFAVHALQRIGFRPAYDLLISSVIGEESGGVGALTTIVNGHTADAVVVLEPTQSQLCPVQAGALTFRLTVRGRATHAAMKNQGISAIAKFLLLHEAIEAVDRQRHARYHNPLYSDPTNIAPISIGTVRGGEWHSTVAEVVVAEGRCGVFPDETPAHVRALLAEIIERAAQADAWLREHPPQLEWFEGQFEACETPADHPLIRTLAGCHASVHGAAPAIKGVTYGADLRLFVNHARMPGVLYGAGDVGLAHAVDESIAIDDVIAAVKTIALLIARWCGGSVRG